MKRAELHAHWCGLISEYEASGQTQREFAEAHGIGEKRFSRWVRKLQQSDEPPRCSNTRGGLVKLVAATPAHGMNGWACRIETGAVVVHLQERPPAAWLLELNASGPSMIGSLPASVGIYLATAPVDMRKGFDGLCGLVRQWEGDLYSGHLFAFISRRGDRIKILSWDRDGFVLWYKRLERGRFKLPADSPPMATLQLDAGQLNYLLDGIDFSRVKRRTAWQPKILTKKDPQ